MNSPHEEALTSVLNLELTENSTYGERLDSIYHFLLINHATVLNINSTILVPFFKSGIQQ